MSSQRQEPMETTEVQEETARRPRKPYTKPEISHELELEVRAGSPLALPNPLDLGLTGE